MRGLLVGVGMVGGKAVKGLALAGGHFGCQTLDGMATGLYCRVGERQSGVTIGLLNTARRLDGLQIGLLNHAGNNPPMLRWLPILNLHIE